MKANINILNELREAGVEELLQADNKNYYTVPGGYFNDFVPAVKANIFISSVPRINTYTLPQGYFENLPGVILDKVNLPAVQSDLSYKENIYQVPEDYFIGFADSVLKKIKYNDISVQQELEELSPLLSQIPKSNVYALPENYFQQLKPFPAVSPSAKPVSKVVSVSSRKRSWMNYAAAACIGAVLFAGGYFFISQNKGNTPGSKPVATAPIEADMQLQMAGLSDSEIESYLKENSNMSVFTNVGTDNDQQNIDIQSLIQEIPNDELQQYLNDDEPEKKAEGI